MLRFLIDTNICIAAMKKQKAELLDAFVRHHGAMAISVVTLGELAFGAENSAKRERSISKMEEFVGRLPIVDIDTDAARHYGVIRAGLQRIGRPIGANDLWIAASARSRGMTVVTDNMDEFRRVPELSVENWLRT